MFESEQPYTEMKEEKNQAYDGTTKIYLYEWNNSC
jgi:hypothetical protein